MNQVPADDRGLLLGDGLFETILWDGGRLDALGAHLERLSRGCAVLGLPVPAAAAAEVAALKAVQDAGLEAARAVVRLTWTGGSGRGLDRRSPTEPRLLASAGPAPRPERPARLMTVKVRRNEGSPASRLKTLSYLDNVLARLEAREAGADEALMLNNAGELACAAAANLFWICEGRLFTPALECGVLDGIMRGRVLEAARSLGIDAIETRQTPQALARAEALLLTNSLIGIQEVSVFDGRSLQPHPLAARLSSWRR